MDAPLERPLQQPSQSPQPPRSTIERIESIHCWTPSLWSLRITRPDNFRFTPGHYARLGLPVGDANNAPIWRPYSIASAPDEDVLEFLLTLIPGGAFTSQLAVLGVGAPILLESAVLGFFIESQLAAGDSLWMLATGSGVGPYVSMLREGSVLKRYRRLSVVHGVRTAAELAYASELRTLCYRHSDQLHYVPVVTREPGATPLAARIPQLITQGALEHHLGETLDPQAARVMVCGNPDFTADMRKLLKDRLFQPCRRGLSGSMLFENYW